MTDFLTRLAARVVAPGSGLRPNAPTRFEPVAGLAGEPGLFEVQEEGEVRAPAPPRRAAPEIDTPVQRALPAEPPSGPNVPARQPHHGAVDASPNSSSRGETAPSPAPAPVAPAEPRASADQPAPAPPRLPPPPEASASPQGNTRRDVAPPDRVTERVVERRQEVVIERQTASEAPQTPRETRDRDERPRRETPQTAPVATPPRPEQAVPAAPRPPRNPEEATAPRIARQASRPDRSPVQPAPAPAPVIVRIDRLEVRVTAPRATAVQAPSPRLEPPSAAPDLDRFLSSLDRRRS